MNTKSWLAIAVIFPQMALIGQAAAADFCLRNADIVSTSSPDGSTLIFHMKDGNVWLNKLHGPCPDLKFNGFVWVIRGTEAVCENQQSLRVLRSGEICTLGKFTKIAAEGTH